MRKYNGTDSKLTMKARFKKVKRVIINTKGKIELLLVNFASSSKGIPNGAIGAFGVIGAFGAFGVPSGAIGAIGYMCDFHVADPTTKK